MLKEISLIIPLMLKEITLINSFNVPESPPLANLFHECEWKDWVNADFPGNTPGGEFELKDQIGSLELHLMNFSLVA